MKLKVFRTSDYVVLLTLVVVTSANVPSIRASTTPSSCANTQVAYAAFGYDGNDVPKQPVLGANMKICNQIGEQVCCTPEMEVMLGTRSRREHDVKMANLTHYIGSAFEVHSKKFDDFFRELLKVSQTRLHDMYVATYGIMYQSNSYIFKDLFKDLEDYYTKGKINLLDAMKNFFNTLLRKMLTVYNSQYRFNDRYLGCAVEYTERLKPFGDVPQKLSITVKRSFVAARTFVRALAAGHEIVKKLLEINHGSVCGVGLLNMNYCQMCLDSPGLKQCSGHCINSVKKCVVSHPELDTEWNTYITSLLLLAERLEGPFNIESVVEPINIKISDAIMNFQEKGGEISQKVFSHCGKPRLEKRETHELEFETYDFKKEPSVRRVTAAGTSLDRLMRETSRKVKFLKDYWKNLPYQYCNSNPQVVSTASEEECWDGIRKTKNNANAVEDMTEKPDPVVNGLIGQEVINLRLITNKLKNAYNGLDVDWIEYADWLNNNKEHGSGSGSGDGPDRYEDDDEDSPRSHDNDWDEGSGSYPEVETKHDKPKIFAAPPSESDFGFSSSTVVPDVKLNGPFSSSVPPTADVSPRMGLTKAIAILVLPMFVVWIGNLF